MQNQELMIGTGN